LLIINEVEIGIPKRGINYNKIKLFLPFKSGEIILSLTFTK